MADQQCAELLCRSRRPTASRSVVRRGDDALAVGAERRALHSALMAGQNTPICLPVSASHSRAVLSSDAVTMRLPSGLNAALTKLVHMAD